MLQISCCGNPFEIGLQHGREATELVHGSIHFYEGLFQKYTQQSWEQVRRTAAVFEREASHRWPSFHEEMQGIAAGSGCDLLDIVALNTRTEIAFGLFSDGCTTLSWTDQEHSLLGQNWDWMEEQGGHLVFLTIKQTGKPVIKMVTEGGIIGKIGGNSLGVGVCLNAIRGKGFDASRLPVHLALRQALECTSALEAVRVLKQKGVAAAAHILVADGMEAYGLEVTAKTFNIIRPDSQGRIIHSNHMLSKHGGLEEFVEPDSVARFVRMSSLVNHVQMTGGQSLQNFGDLFDDHEGFPTSICRSQEGVSLDASLFNIVMDLRSRAGVVRVGRPCLVDEVISITF